MANIQSYNAGSTPLTSDQYQYNSVGQLTQSNNSELWPHDDIQLRRNLLASPLRPAAGPATTTTPTATAMPPATPFGPDNELLSDGVWNYTYNKEGDLVEKISTTTAEHWVYSYNASKVESTEAQHYDDTDTLLCWTRLTGMMRWANRSRPKMAFGTVTEYGVDGWNSNMPAGTGNANFNDWAVINADGTLQMLNDLWQSTESSFRPGGTRALRLRSSRRFTTT